MRRLLLSLIFILLAATSVFAQATPTATPTPTAFDFPASPTLNQQVTGPDGQVYVWDGTKWVHGAGGGGGGGGGAPLINPAGGQNNYAPIANPVFTGSLTLPTSIVCTGGQVLASISTILAPTCVTVSGGGGAPLVNPAGGQNNYAPIANAALTGTLTLNGTALTGLFAPLTNPTGGQNNYAPLASPTFTGTLTSSIGLFTGPLTSQNNILVYNGQFVYWTFGPATTLQIISTGASNADILNNGMTSGTGTYTAYQTSAAGIHLAGSSIQLNVNTGLTSGNTYTPTQIAAITASGLTMSAGTSITTPSLTATNSATFPDGSSISTAGASNGLAGNVYGFNSSTGIAIGTARTAGSPTIGGNMLILGQATSPAVLMQATGFVPDGAIIYTTGTTGREWFTHNATTTNGGTTWTAQGNNAEIINFSQAGGAGPQIGFSINSGQTVGVAYTPTLVASIGTTGINIATGSSYFLNGQNQFQHGTFVPTFLCSGGNPVINPPGGGTVVGNWWAVGNLVFFYAQAFWNGITTAGSGNASIGGLPFPAIGGGSGQGGFEQTLTVTNATGAAGHRIEGTLFNGNTSISLYDTGSFGGDWLFPVTCANAFANTASGFFVNGWYQYQ